MLSTSISQLPSLVISGIPKIQMALKSAQSGFQGFHSLYSGGPQEVGGFDPE